MGKKKFGPPNSRPKPKPRKNRKKAEWIILIKEAILDFRPVADQIMKILGWRSGCDFDVSYNIREEGDIIFNFAARNSFITDQDIQKIKKLVPEADEISYWINEEDDDNASGYISIYFAPSS